MGQTSDDEPLKEADHLRKMARNAPGTLPDRRPRCARCGDVIGVYEPLVHVREALVRRTSRAAEPQIVSASGAVYHEDCYKRERVSHRLRRPRSRSSALSPAARLRTRSRSARNGQPNPV